MSAWKADPRLSEFRAAMREMGMTETELARRLGWHRQRVSRLLNGDVDITIHKWSLMLEALSPGLSARVRAAVRDTIYAEVRERVGGGRGLRG